MVSSVYVLVHVILLSLYDFLLFLVTIGFDMSMLRASVEAVLELLSSRFLSNFCMSRLVSSVEVALKRYSGRFPLEGSSLTVILLTDCV